MKNVNLKMKQGMQGFTLMELMIVISILGVLAAIAYPAYGRYVERTNRKVAVAEMGVVGQKLERYYTINNGTYSDIDASGNVLNKNTKVDNYLSSTSDKLEGYKISVTISDEGQAYTIKAKYKTGGVYDKQCPELTMKSDGTKTPSASCFK